MAKPTQHHWNICSGGLCRYGSEQRGESFLGTHSQGRGFDSLVPSELLPKPVGSSFKFELFHSEGIKISSPFQPKKRGGGGQGGETASCPDFSSLVALVIDFIWPEMYLWHQSRDDSPCHPSLPAWQPDTRPGSERWGTGGQGVSPAHSCNQIRQVFPLFRKSPRN